MKRLVAVSDSHGMKGALEDAVCLALKMGRIDTFVFLGDGLCDLDIVSPSLLEENPDMRMIAVRGNCDSTTLVSEKESFLMDGVHMLASHGHTYRVKTGLQNLCFAAREMKASVVLYGHTHIADIQLAHGVWLINPGALCDASTGKPFFAEVLLGDDGQVEAKLIGRNGNSL